MTKQFLFLYPIKEYFDAEIETGDYVWKAEKSSGSFLDYYRFCLNTCINERYRKDNFEINFVLFKDHEISEIIELNKNDRIFYADVDFGLHCSEKIYPNPDLILKNLPKKIEHLRIAGFHRSDCVQKFAKGANEKGLNVLVDEDLTEFFEYRIRQNNFNLTIYPGYIPPNKDNKYFALKRKNKPWLLQNY